MVNRKIAAAVAGAALAGAAAAGCSGGSGHSGGSLPAFSPAHDGATGTPASRPPTTGKLGTAFTIHGTESSETTTPVTYKMKLLKVIQNVPPYVAPGGGGLDNSPPAGQHLAAAEFQASTISGTYGGFYTAVQGVTGSGQVAQSSESDVTVDGQEQGTGIGYPSVPPGTNSVGWAVVDVPNGQQVSKIQFSDDRDFDDTVTWTLS